MKITKQVIKQFLLVAGLTILGLILVNGVAMAQGLDPTQNCPAFLADLNPALCGGTFRSTVLLVINFFLGFLGLLATIMIIYGGFLYVSSAGNEENVNKAKKILLYAVVGVLVIALSFLLVNVLFRATTGSDVGI